MIEKNLLDKSITNDIQSPYFAHLNPKKFTQTNQSNQLNGPPQFPFSKPYYRFKKTLIQSNITLAISPELSKNNFELHKKYIEEGHNPNEIAKMIRNDEIEKFQETSSQPKFNFNQIIEPSMYERCSFINQINVTLIDYAAFFGSIKCFKYLLMNGSSVENTGKYAVAGGNEEIIHLCEQNHSSFEGAYEAAIMFHRNDIFKYVYENKLEKSDENSQQNKSNTQNFQNYMNMFNFYRNNKKTPDINDLGVFCIKNGNYEILSLLEKEVMNVNDSSINDVAQDGNLYLIRNLFQHCQIPKNILAFAAESGNMELIKYVLTISGIDVNALNVYFNNLKMLALSIWNLF